MKITKVISALLLSVLVVDGATAQDAPMSLSDCLNMAMKNNQGIAIARYDEQIGDQQVRQTRGRALPQVNGSGNLTDNYKRQVLVLTAGTFGATEDQVVPVGNVFNTSASVNASQAILDPAVFTALKAARAGKDYYKQSTKQMEEDVIYNTAQIYYSILAAMEQVKALDSNIAKLTKIVQATQGQYDNGLARKIDLDRINVNLTNSQTARLRQLNQVAVLTANLKVLLGVSMETDIVLDGLSFSEIEQEVGQQSPALDFNVADRTEIKVLDAQIMLTDLQTKAIRAENYPSLSAFANYSYNGVTNKFGDFFQQDGAIWYGVGSFGLNLKVPLFDGFARQARTKQSYLQMKQLQTRKDNVALSLRAGYQSALIQMENSTSSIIAQKKNVELAKDVSSSSEANYNLGLATLTDLLEAQSSYIDAQNNYTKALLDYKLAELETIRSSGKLRSLL